MKALLTPPGPQTDPMANLYALRKDPLGFFEQLHREHGDLVRFDMGPRAYHLVNHPDLIKELLVSQDRNFSKWFAVDRIKQLLGNGLFVSEGDYHRRQRRMIQPAFHRERIASYAASMTHLSRALRDRWQNGTTVDVTKDMNWLTLMIVAETLFGANVDAEAAGISEALTEILDQFERSTLADDEVEDFEKWRNQLDDIILNMIATRRREGTDNRLDLLSMLLDMREEETGEALNDEQVRDEAKTIFLAGHETTANALSWTWHLLSEHPEIADKFYSEIDKLEGRPPEMSDLAQLSYVEWVFAEALRLYPPVWALGRQALRDTKLGDFAIPEGSVAIVSLSLTHRDPRYFPEPEKFDPLRWTPEAKATRPRYSYLPFSAGSRQCLGEAFAWMESTLALATLGQHFRLQKVSQRPVLTQPQLTLRPRNGLRMKVEAR